VRPPQRAHGAVMGAELRLIAKATLRKGVILISFRDPFQIQTKGDAQGNDHQHDDTPFHSVEK
jgi:hypothetical protein